MVEVVDDAPEITDAVAVGVGERLRIDLVITASASQSPPMRAIVTR
jgi:hypothetical protein